MVSKTVFAVSAWLLLSRTTAQLDHALPFYTGFNSSFTLTPAQIESAQLDAALVDSIQNIVNFDRSQLAFGGPAEDDFYTLPPLTNATSPLQPGQILKVQAVTDPTAYAIPPNTALSRILYTTTNFNGTVIPTSGFILWPYTPRRVPGDDVNPTNKAPLVVWTHGTSGFFQQQAPSAHRGLWYDDAVPFTLASAGYAVFAPDYAGLGIANTWNGTRIYHQYHFSSATAGDTLYGVRAALHAFPDSLGSDFVVIGHSQGGGVAWAVAEALAYPDHPYEDLSAGYKGTIAVSPTTKVLTPSGPINFILPTIAQMLQSVFPTFQVEDWLTPLGAARLKLTEEIQGSVTVFQQLFLLSNETARPDYRNSWYADAFSQLGDASRRDFAGPLLVIQGDTDTYIPYEVTQSAVEDTWASYPDKDLEFLVASGVSHVPVLFATRHLWMQWIEDRLGGKPLAQTGNVRTDIQSFLPNEQYQSRRASSYLWANLPGYTYQVPLAV